MQQEHVKKTSDNIMEEQAGIAHREEFDKPSKGFLLEGMEPYLLAGMKIHFFPLPLLFLSLSLARTHIHFYSSFILSWAWK
jgi:hypothetical protein